MSVNKVINRLIPQPVLTRASRSLGDEDSCLEAKGDTFKPPVGADCTVSKLGGDQPSKLNISMSWLLFEVNK